MFLMSPVLSDTLIVCRFLIRYLEHSGGGAPFASQRVDIFESLTTYLVTVFFVPAHVTFDGFVIR